MLVLLVVSLFVLLLIFMAMMRGRGIPSGTKQTGPLMYGGDNF